MSISQVKISNEALVELRERPITAMEEQSFQAQECSRQYPLVLAEMLEVHEWGFAGKRQQLAEVANDRGSEWPHAYALPDDLGTPRRLLPNLAGVTVGNPVSLFPEGYTREPVGLTWIRRYEIEGGKLYAWLPEAVLEYGAKDIEPAKMPAMFRRALALGMAARMARTLRDDPRLKGELQDEARVALERAMADDKNRQPQGELVEEVGAVRAGWHFGLPYGWPPFPKVD